MIRSLNLLPILCCTSLLHAQSAYHSSYEFSTLGEVYSTHQAQRLDNGDILLNMSATSSPNNSTIARIDPAGNFLWASEMVDQFSVDQIVNEDANGNLLVAVNRQDSATGRYMPAFIQFSSTGAFLQAHYYDFDPLEMAIRNSAVGGSGATAATLASEQPFLSARLVVSDQGSAMFNCRMTEIDPVGTGNAVDNFRIAAGSAGNTMELYFDYPTKLKFKRRVTSGSTLAEREYLINGAATTNHILDFVKVNNNTFAALIKSNAALPNGLIVLVIDDLGDVIAAHGFEHPDGWVGYGELFTTPNGDLLVYLKGAQAFPRAFARIDIHANNITPLPMDSMNGEWLVDAVFNDTSDVNMVYLHSSIRHKDIHDAASNCENEKGVQYVNVTATATTITTPQTIVSPQATAYTPQVLSISLLRMPLCFSTRVEESGSYNISVYPNPALEQLNISTPYGNWQHRLVDATGRSVLSFSSRGTQKTVDVSILHNGTYLLHSRRGDDLMVTRVMIN